MRYYQRELFGHDNIIVKPLILLLTFNMYKLKIMIICHTIVLVADFHIVKP